MSVSNGLGQLELAGEPATSYPLLTAPDRDLLQRTVVASTLVGSALIHGSVAGEHFGEWLLAGMFFVAVQLVELLLALAAVFAWDRPVARLVVLTGLGTVLVWLVSRTVGMPIGPADFRVPEPVGMTDVLCSLLELASVVAALPAARLRTTEPRGSVRPGGRSGPGGRAAAAVAAAAALSLTGAAVVPVVFNAPAHHAQSAVR
ncbi:hypothetical protein [Nocardioides pocheonensis]|uniref:hypothetical protein n=1 Tax=Nocardioides pocheonensis TaxID=661485 RepID=UPI0011CE1ABC|nr:hypothetical protein [Nocardioides pocheonensis]